MKKLVLIALLVLCVNNAFSQGKYIKDGRTYVADAAFLEQFNSFINTTDRELWPYLADIRDALKRGKTVTYDSLRNTLNGDFYFSNLSERQNKRMSRKGGTYWDALFNTRKQKAHKAVYSLMYFNRR